METLSELPLALTLLVLALVDGLSIGTLLIPVFLLLTPGRVRVGRILLYLATICGFYFVIGAAFSAGLVNLVDVAGDAISSTGGQIARLVAGAGLLVAAFFIPTKPREQSSTPKESANLVARDSVAASADPAAAPRDMKPSGGRLSRWRDRLMDERASRGAVMAVALGAGIVELATMLPYIGAMTILAQTDLNLPLRIGALVTYCVLMAAPAVMLLVARVVAAPLMERPLNKLAAWLERTGPENTAWIMGIVGFLIARGAASELGLFDAIDQWSHSLPL